MFKGTIKICQIQSDGFWNAPLVLKALTMAFPGPNAGPSWRILKYKQWTLTANGAGVSYFIWLATIAQFDMGK